jgi:23S rRNA pseudouridine955/2504/2580 synthase
VNRFVIGPNDAGRRADRFVAKALPHLGAHTVQALFRKKDVKIGRRPLKPAEHLQEGAVLLVYPPAALPVPAREGADVGEAALPPVDTAYEDDNLLILWKPPGLLSQGAPGQDSLEGRGRRLLARRGEPCAETDGTFAPSLCHRLDRCTEGLCVMAKNAPALRDFTERLRGREIRKFYRCLVHGKPRPPRGEMEDFLFKDSQKRMVYVKPAREPGAKTAVTRYAALSERGPLTLVEAEIVTGRTHQIRAQFASRGHPILGDGKYGSLRADKPFAPARTALCAVRLEFAFGSEAGALEYLRGRVIERYPDWARE